MKRLMLILAIALMASSVQAAWTYVAYDDPDPTHADFVGSWTPEGDPGVPDVAKNPNGPWAYVDGAGALLTPQTGLGWSGQIGWGDTDPVTGFYDLFRAGWPIEVGKELDVGISGHSNSAITFTVPTFEDAGSTGVWVDGIIQVYGGDPRAQQMLVDGVYVVSGPADNLEYTGSAFVPCVAGQTLLIEIAPYGQPTGTFASWDLTITEGIPEPMTLALLGLGSLVALRKRR